MSISILPVEIIEYILKFTDKPTLQNCLRTPYLIEMAQRELRRRYKICSNILTKIGFDKTEAKIQLIRGKIDLYGPNFNYIHHKVTDANVITLAKYCPELTEIYLDICSDITDASINALANYCPKLIVIGLYNCSNITDVAIMNLINKCRNIERINTTYCDNISIYTRGFLRDRRIRIR